MHHYNEGGATNFPSSAYQYCLTRPRPPASAVFIPAVPYAEVLTAFFPQVQVVNPKLIQTGP